MIINEQVTIYVDPFKKSVYEGIAVLINHIADYRVANMIIQLWDVEFLSEPGRLYRRYIDTAGE